ncbi:MAG: DNA recombination protein RmuC [Candidatus Sungbacteria bacterium]|nr:DNA recombination protein RmuC [Candidatus Sungbacteria bacterium]
MGIEFIILAVILIAGFAGLFVLLNHRRNASPEGGQDLLLLQNQLNEITRTLDGRLAESAQMQQAQFGMLQAQSGASTRIIQEVTEKLVRLDETNKQVVNFADQLRSLQDILKNPKQRGILGEYYLENLLKNVLPPGSFQMQYAFPGGLIADAVIFVKEKKICIDSKFSLENYNRIVESRDQQERERLEKQFRQDLKDRIDETSKYVKPEEGTMDFAFMFIPAEAIYYDLLINQVGAVKVNTQDLIQYAFKDRHVIIVSPTSFLAYLQTVLQGLRALQIEESAKEIRKRVEELGRHLGAYDTFMQKLGTHLGTSVNMYNNAYKEFGKIDKDVLRITGEKTGVEPMTLALPEDAE